MVDFDRRLRINVVWLNPKMTMGWRLYLDHYHPPRFARLHIGNVPIRLLDYERGALTEVCDQSPHIAYLSDYASGGFRFRRRMCSASSLMR